MDDDVLTFPYYSMAAQAWQIDTDPTDSLPQSVEEKAVLEMIEVEPNPFNKTKNGTQAEPEIEAVLANSHDV